MNLVGEKAPIRPDIHERFITILQRAEAKLESERKAALRARLHTDAEDEPEDEPLPSP